MSGSLAGTLLAGNEGQLPGRECLVIAEVITNNPQAANSQYCGRNGAPPPTPNPTSRYFSIRRHIQGQRRGRSVIRGLHHRRREKTLIRIEIPDDLEAKVRAMFDATPALEAGVRTYVGTPLHRQAKIAVVGSEPLAAAAKRIHRNRRWAAKAGQSRPGGLAGNSPVPSGPGFIRESHAAQGAEHRHNPRA